jgi:hypothetical protein
VTDSVEYRASAFPYITLGFDVFLPCDIVHFIMLGTWTCSVMRGMNLMKHTEKDGRCEKLVIEFAAHDRCHIKSSVFLIQSM